MEVDWVHIVPLLCSKHIILLNPSDVFPTGLDLERAQSDANKLLHGQPSKLSLVWIQQVCNSDNASIQLTLSWNGKRVPSEETQSFGTTEGVLLGKP